MNLIGNIGARIKDDQFLEPIFKTAGVVSLTSICAYAGTFFFTLHKPMNGAFYLGIVSLTSYVAYQVLEKMKDYVDSPRLKYAITSVQLLQIPVVFYLLPGSLNSHLTSAAKLEIIIATAHFVAVPVFFHLGLQAWNDPSSENIASATGVMLALANGLRSYIRI